MKKAIQLAMTIILILILSALAPAQVFANFRIGIMQDKRGVASTDCIFNRVSGEDFHKFPVLRNQFARIAEKRMSKEGEDHA